MMTRRQAALACTAAITAWAQQTGPRVRLTRVPKSGLQPQIATDDVGVLHVIYYGGDAHHGNISYVRSQDGGATFSTPLAVNSHPDSAIAVGTIRGAQLALGQPGRVHVAWNGSAKDRMLYTRLNARGDAFEPERNLMLHSSGLDGGGSVAADRAGNVYVAWHGFESPEAPAADLQGEARRHVWIAKSQDNGRSFSPERKAWPQPTGACGCCGMKIFADRQPNVSVLYRSATQSVHRDIYMLNSKDQGGTFQGGLLHKWEINACPMSSMDIAANENMRIGAWETGGQVYWARLDPDAARASQPVAAPGDGKNRKHPRLAINRNGDILLVWTEGTGWQKGGSLAWQIYDRTGQPQSEKQQLPGIPVWSFAAALARPDDGFSILY